MKDCAIRETWNVLGMRGTGSHDVEFNDVFVRDDLTFLQSDALANLGAALSPVALGVARHALDAFVELASTKKPTGERELLRDRVTAQAQLGEAEGYLQAARSFFYDTVAEADSWRSSGHAPTNAERARTRLGSVMAAQLSARAVDFVHEAAGLTSAANDCAIGRCWRDVHVIRQHITIATTRFEVVGRVCLDMPPGSPLI
jgi:alkylation response protein AidB-like acyl-CoA dehydrogenase